MAQIRTANPTADMASMLAKARKMRDSELADVLAGKNMSIPQYAAMAEAMGRRDLRLAVAGAEAQKQAQQPSIKDQLLAEQSGLAALPAPNMESMDMAAGGIVAFEDGGKVQHFYDQGLVEAQQKEDQESLLRTAKEMGLSVADVLALAPRAGAGILNAGPIRSLRAAGVNLPYIPDVAGGDFSSKTPFYDKYIRQADIDKDAAKALEKPIGDQPGDYPQKPGENAKTKDNKTAPATPKADVTTAVDVSKPTTFEERPSPYAGLKLTPVDTGKLKSQSFGEGLMRLSKALLTTPGMKGVGEGIGELAATGAASRKELAELEKSGRDYNLLLAKAEDAHAQGNDELALKYKTLAEQTDYHKTMGKAALMTAGAHQMAAQNKGTGLGQIGLKDATKEFNDLTPQQKRALPIGVVDARTYWQYVNGNFSGFVNAAPGENATILTPKS